MGSHYLFLEDFAFDIIHRAECVLILSTYIAGQVPYISTLKCFLRNSELMQLSFTISTY